VIRVAFPRELLRVPLALRDELLVVTLLVLRVKDLCLLCFSEGLQLRLLVLLRCALRRPRRLIGRSLRRPSGLGVGLLGGLDRVVVELLCCLRRARRNERRPGGLQPSLLNLLLESSNSSL